MTQCPLSSEANEKERDGLTGESFYSFLRSRQFWLLTTCWVLLIAWHPFVLGFYYDDWATIVEPANNTLPFSSERWLYISNEYAGRIFGGVTIFSLSSFFDANPFLWQSFLAVAYLGFVLSYYCLLLKLGELFRLSPAVARNSATLVSLLWLVAPWLSFISAWPTVSTAPLFLIAMTLSFICLLNAWKQQRGWSLPAVLLFGLTGLAYEGFIFQYILFYLLGFTAGIHQYIARTKIVTGLGLYTGVQVLLIVLYRMYSTRSAKQDTLHYFFKNLKELPKAFVHMAGNYQILLIIAYAVAGLVILYALFCWLKANAQTETIGKRIIIPVGVALLGIGMSVGLLSVGGVLIRGYGTFSRSTIGISYWLFMALFFLVAPLFSLNDKRQRCCLGLLMVVYVAMGVVSVRHIYAWHNAWMLEQDILSKAPVAKIAGMDKGSVVLLDAPVQLDKVYVFYGAWSISAAMNNMYPQIRVRSNSDRYRAKGWRPFFVRANYDTIWDGKSVRQGQFGVPASELWLWRYQTGQLFKVKPPATISRKRF